MRDRFARHLLIALLGLPLACATTSAEDPDGDTEPDTIWAYIETKYDADGDGQVDATEYDRGDETFARLDRDDDGALTADDFEAAGGGPGAMQMTPEVMGTMTLVQYFQQDDDRDLAREEVSGRVVDLDADGDGYLSRDEASLAFPEAGPGAGMDRFAMLLEVADDDDDELLSSPELLAFFDQVDSDGNGVLAQPGRGRRGGRGRAAGPPEGARPGDMAPDFSLTPDHGGAPVTLSDFRGEQPVALVFGSYT